MVSLEAKILKAIKSNKLNSKILGERRWFNYFIKVTELVWARNNFDGYQIEIYSNNTKN
jgi:hypothetical protein